MPTANEVYRDFNTDGVPASGLHKPVLSEVRDLLTGYEEAIANNIATLGGSGVSAFAVTMFTGGAVRIDCRGDSTQHGHDTLNPPTYLATKTAPQRLQEFLQDYYFNSSILVTNNGVDSTRSGQMLDGTDGAGGGLTFAAQMAISTTHIVICNHGLNDCQSSIDLLEYRSNLIQFINICRDAGKIPILETPNPIWAITSYALGTLSKANRLKAYVQVMKDVAAETATVLVDVFTMVHSWIRTGVYKIQDIIPDGVHPSLLVYSAIGSLLAQPFVHPQGGLHTAEQTISVGEGIANIAPANDPIPAPATRSGVQLISTAAVVGKSIKVAVRVDEPGLDIWIAYPIWGGGNTTTGIVWDGAVLGFINQFSSLSLGSEFIHDHEICIARNVPVGLHLLTMTATTADSIGLSYIRARRTLVSKDFSNGAGTYIRKRRSVFPSIQLVGAAADNTRFVDEWAISRFLAGDTIDIQFDAVMGKDTQFVLHGIETVVSGGAGPMTARMGIGMGLDATTGYATVYQITGAGTYALTAVGSTDLSSTTVSHIYRLRIAAGTQLLQVFVDNGAEAGGSPVTITSARPFPGGFMGLRSNVAGRSIQVTDLRLLES